MYKVMVQASPDYRTLPDDILKLLCKNDRGWNGSSICFYVNKKKFMVLTRWQGIICTLRLGNKWWRKTGNKQWDRIENTVQKQPEKKLPKRFDIDWAGISRDEANTINEKHLRFLICLLFIYLVLSGQYESFLLLASSIGLPTEYLAHSFYFLYWDLRKQYICQNSNAYAHGLLGKCHIDCWVCGTKTQPGHDCIGSSHWWCQIKVASDLNDIDLFIAGLLPLVIASGAGAVGNRTIGTAALGGCCLGQYLVWSLFLVYMVFFCHIIWKVTAIIEKMKIQ